MRGSLWLKRPVDEKHKADHSPIQYECIRLSHQLLVSHYTASPRDAGSYPDQLNLSTVLLTGYINHEAWSSNIFFSLTFTVIMYLKGQSSVVEEVTVDLIEEYGYNSRTLADWTGLRHRQHRSEQGRNIWTHSVREISSFQESG